MRALFRVICAVMLLCGGLAAAVQAGVPGFMKARMGSLEGEFYQTPNQPLANGVVSFFNEKGGDPPIVGSIRRVPDLVSRTDAKGRFSAKLLPGRYYMGAMVRDIKDGPGPPRKGEEYFFAMANPGELRLFEVRSRRVNKVGRVRGTHPENFKEFKRYVVIRGRVVDEKGQPFTGAIITVKDKLNSPRPKYIGERVSSDGRYEVKLPPGRYYIMARESLRRGRPKVGSFVGAYGRGGPSNSTSPSRAQDGPKGKGGTDGEAVALECRASKVYENINITMYAIPDPEETRAQKEREARKRKAAAAGADPPGAFK